MEKVRAGRSLHPARWKDGARVCVALSFDSDHETSTLREGSVSPGRLSQGQYGSRAAVPRILGLLRRHDIRASFFVPAVVALLHPDEQRRVVDEGHEIAMHGWIHEMTSQLTETVERDLMRRAHETLAKIAGRPPGGRARPVVGLQPDHARADPRARAPLRLVADGRRRALRDPGGRRADGDRRAAGGVDQGRRVRISG